VDEIGKILPFVVRKQICHAEPYVLEILLPLWPRIAGKGIAQHSHPAFFASGVLTLTCDSATWTTQLLHLSQEVRAAINGFLGEPVVKKMRIKTVTQPSLFVPPEPQRGIVAPPLLGKEAVDTTSIVDPAIASALASSYAKYFNRPQR